MGYLDLVVQHWQKSSYRTPSLWTCSTSTITVQVPVQNVMVIAEEAGATVKAKDDDRSTVCKRDPLDGIHAQSRSGGAARQAEILAHNNASACVHRVSSNVMHHIYCR
jgi:hypothetical protein